RQMLDEAGWTECKITVSNALDERLIAGLLRQGAQVDSFGVGERLITARSEPVFGGVYKLAAIEDKDGNIIPKIKISENVGKITNPHFKKVYRFYSKDSGMAEADYIACTTKLWTTRSRSVCDPTRRGKKCSLTSRRASCRCPFSAAAVVAKSPRRYPCLRRSAHHALAEVRALTIRTTTTSTCRKSC
ncbi:MAG: hypothetical protein ACLTG4_05175, partial [Oscillospiraceae bacterium]